MHGSLVRLFTLKDHRAGGLYEQWRKHHRRQRGDKGFIGSDGASSRVRPARVTRMCARPGCAPPCPAMRITNDAKRKSDRVVAGALPSSRERTQPSSRST